MLLLTLLLLSTPHYMQACKKNACKNLYDYPHRCLSASCYISGNVETTTPQMIVSNNYTYETYTVTTEDGYILTLFRIPPQGNDTKGPVLLQHGIGLDSSSWVCTGNRSLAFNLVDQGYDVWLGNNRGTRYSRNHGADFYGYNLDDLAVKDLNATLLHIKQQSGTILYIGHSRGATIMSMFSSEFPEHARSLVKSLVFLSPVVYFDNRTRPILTLATFIVILFKFFGQPAVFYPSKTVHDFTLTFCTIYPYICRHFIDAGFGKTEQFLSDDLLNLYSKFSATISFGDYLQYSQIYRSGNFQKYDYGVSKNFEVYGQQTPPLYNLSNIKIPTVLYYGKNDKFTSIQSVNRLHNELGSTIKMLKAAPMGNMEAKYDFNHLDFLFSRYIKEFLYDDLFSTLGTFGRL